MWGCEQTHFTVMDYAGHKVEVPSEVEFLQAFERENGAPFSVVDQKIDAMLKARGSEGQNRLCE
jgi:hypothetical protein